MSQQKGREEDQVFTALAWFVAGAALGAAIAVLFAPKTGKDTRRYLSRTAQKSRDAVNDTTREVVERGRELYERGRQLVDDAAELFERGRKLVRG